MRRTLFAAAALAPLCLVAGQAWAADVTNGRTTPIATSSAGGAAADNINITTDGSVKITSVGPAVTIDSDNTLTNAGLIDVENANNSTAVLVQGGHTGGLTNTGTIENIEDFTPADANSDGVFESPLATGGGRYAVRVTGAAPFIGSLATGGSIFVEGADSAGISVEAPLQGSILHSGTIGVTGDRSFGLRTTAPVSGDITLTGSVGASGQGATAVSIGGDVGGALRLYSSVDANGFSTAARSTSDDLLKKIMATPSELEQSGAALVVGGNVAGGIILGGAPFGTDPNNTTLDADRDGIVDSAEATGTITNFGSAPSLLIGGAGRNVGIGAFGTGDNGYGVILRGEIASQGLYDGISATGVQIGGTGGTASLAGGIRLTGTLSASAYEAAATGLRIGAGGVVPELRNENSLSALIQHSSVGTATNATATGVLVEAGGSLSKLTNYGAISAAVTGSNASASAVVDQSGTLSTVLNEGAITAVLNPAVAGDPIHGRTIALDLRNNTSGVSLVQQTNPSPIPVSTTTNPTTGAVTVVTTSVTPSIVGDVLLGSGPNTVQLLAGTMTGALDLGGGAASLTIDNGASYSGFLTHSGALLNVNVANGSLVSTNATTLQAQSLNVGASSTISFAVDPVNGKAGGFDVSGAATLATGAKVGVNLISNLTGSQTYTLIHAGTLNIGAVQSLISSTPYLTIANLSADQSAGTLSLELRRRTPAEAGLNSAEAAAFDSMYGALPHDPGVQDAVFAQTDRAGFIGIYDQMLPDYGGGLFRLASEASRAASRAAAEGGPGGGWVQEITVGAQQTAASGALPYRALAFGVAGGVERESRIGVLGIDAGFVTGDTHVRGLPGDDLSSLTQLNGGLNWRAALGGLRLDARAGGGYAHYDFRRQLIVKDAAGATTLSRSAEGKANGWSLSGRLGASYRAEFGAFYLQPGAHLDYFRLSQGAYSETGGGDGFDLVVDSRTGSETSGVASIRLGAKWGGETFQWRPEIEVGYRDIFSGTPGDLTARFAGADSTTFSLSPASQDKGGAIGRIGLSAGNDLYDLSFSAGLEHKSNYTEGDLHFRARLLF